MMDTDNWAMLTLCWGESYILALRGEVENHLGAEPKPFQYFQLKSHHSAVEIPEGALICSYSRLHHPSWRGFLKDGTADPDP